VLRAAVRPDPAWHANGACQMRWLAENLMSPQIVCEFFKIAIEPYKGTWHQK
jgi:hypothetical protein